MLYAVDPKRDELMIPYETCKRMGLWKGSDGPKRHVKAVWDRKREKGSRTGWTGVRRRERWLE